MEIIGRFNKINVADAIIKQMQALENNYGFKECDGWSVTAGLSTEATIAFGQYDAYREMLEAIYDR